MIEIIPAIDLIDGKCVRLTQGDYNTKKIYSSNPYEVAKRFEDNGITRLHIVDLDGAKNGKVTNLEVLETISTKTQLNIDFGGGIRTTKDFTNVLNAGATAVSIGSIAIKNEALVKEWAVLFGGHRLFIGADVQDENIVINGWQNKTNINVHDFISSYGKVGITNFFCTDIAKDGMLAGTANELYIAILKKTKGINLVASGGVSSIKDIDLLDESGCNGVIIGKAIYENRIQLKDLKKYL